MVCAASNVQEERKKISKKYAYKLKDHAKKRPVELLSVKDITEEEKTFLKPGFFNLIRCNGFHHYYH